jgi:hypothetical protein
MEKYATSGAVVKYNSIKETSASQPIANHLQHYQAISHQGSFLVVVISQVYPWVKPERFRQIFLQSYAPVA